MEWPTYFIYHIAVEHPAMCSDGFTYEKICLSEWLERIVTSPMARQLIEGFLLKRKEERQEPFQISEGFTMPLGSIDKSNDRI